MSYLPLDNYDNVSYNEGDSSSAYRRGEITMGQEYYDLSEYNERKMQMKKVLVLMITLAMMLTMAACGIPATENIREGDGSSVVKNEKEEKNDDEEVPSATSKEVEIGTVLSAPEIGFGNGNGTLFVSFMTYDENGKVEESREITLMNMPDDTYVFYLTDPLKVDELIFDVSDEKIELYYKDVFATEYIKDTTSSQEELRKKLDESFDALGVLGFGTYDDIKFTKNEDQESLFTGSAYSYTLQMEDETVQILVDKETGVWVSVKHKGKDLVSVMDIKTADVKLPDYQ